MSACKIYQLAEEQQYPKLFEWKNIKECDDQSLMEVATILCQLIVKFNGVSNSYCKLMNEHQKFEDRISYLTNQCKRLEDCENCDRLQKCLESSNLKIQTLADVFGQVFNKDKTLEKLGTNDKSDIDKVHDIFTQMVDGFKCDKTNRKNIKRKLSTSPTKKTNDPTSKIECDNYGTSLKKTRQRNLTPQKTPEVTPDKLNAEESICSPILSRGKQNRSFSAQEKLPLVNLSNRIDELTKTFASPKKELTSISTNQKLSTSPSLLRRPPTDEEKTPSPQHVLKSEPLTVENLENNENKRSSLSLLQNVNNKKQKNDSEEVSVKQSMRVKKSPKKHKKFKQAQLSFSAAKNKKPLDITSVDSFHGGLRQFPAESFLTKDNEDEMLKIALQLSLNENFQKVNADDEDIIDASPSNQPTFKQKKHKVQVHRRSTPTKVSKSGDRVVVPDDEETMVFTAHIDNHKVSTTRSNTGRRHHIKTSPSSSVLGEKQNSNMTGQSSSPSKIRKKVPVTKGVESDFIYVEPVVRKKAEKKSLPGWSCKKCKDFYEVAFEGDDEMIRQKMNECSRHRGNFNPERMDTPAGFWDLKMPPTQDTEAFNKRNNRT